MVTENTVLRKVWLELGSESRLFRVNTGRAWVSGTGQSRRLDDGSVLLPKARPVTLGFGLADGRPLKGAADLNGWTTVTITPDMVGRKVAVFTALEIKRPRGGKIGEEQRNYCDQVNYAGGISGIVNTPEAASKIIASWKRAGCI